MSFRPALVVACVVTLLACPIASAQWWRFPEMAVLGDGTPGRAPVLPLDALAYAEAERFAVESVTQWRRLDAPDRMHDEFVSQSLRSTSGRWMAAALGSGWSMQLRHGGHDHWRSVVDRWRAERPTSRMAKFAEVMLWEGHAWAARGHGLAPASPVALKAFRERLAKAVSLLEAMGDEGRASPLWHRLALGLSGAAGSNASTLDKLHAAAVERFPTYLPLHETRLHYLLPRWGGDYRKVDAFIERVVQVTQATEGRSFYARLYAGFADDIESDGDDLFEVTPATWPKLQAAFEDLVTRYPDAENRNLYAMWACRMRDRESTAKLLLQLGNDARINLQRKGLSTDGCRRFALLSA